MGLLSTVRPNCVQSIRAFRVMDLQEAAIELGHHFLVANCGQSKNKRDVLASIARGFYFPDHFGENFDALYDCLTSLVHKAGPQPGFVIVLEQLPHTAGFDREAREILLDVFRNAAEFWEKRQIPFRMFYSYA